MPVLLNGHLQKHPPKLKRGERQKSKRGERPPLKGQKYPQGVNAPTPRTPKNYPTPKNYTPPPSGSGRQRAAGGCEVPRGLGTKAQNL